MSSRSRLLIVAAVVLAAVVVAFVVTRGRGGSGSKPAGAAGGSAAADPWDSAGGAAGSAGGPGLPGMRGGGPAWLRSRPAGPPVEVTGVVRLAGAGTPVAGAEVAFLNETGENTAVADGAGRYSIKVASGVPWKVHARTETAVGYPESFVPGGDAPVRDLEIHPTALVRGRVVDMRGAAVADAEVSLHVEAAARNLLESALPLSTTTDGGGRFELASLPGAVTVKGAKGMQQGVGALATLAPGETAEVEVKLLDPVTLGGHVVGADDKPLAGAKILVAATISQGGPTEKKQADSKDDGSFELVVPAGWIRIEARHQGDLSPATARWFGSGERHTDLTFKVAPPALLRGKVVTTDGAPVVGARIRLNAHAIYDTTTRGGGIFEVSAPGDQAYIVRVRHSDGTLDRQVAAWNGEEVFVMRRFGAIKVVVDRGAGAAAGEVAVAIDSFLPEGEAAPRAPGETRFRGVGGAVTLPGLEPGLYDLTATTDAGSARLPRVAVTEGATREVKVTLAAPVAVRGKVRSGNQPVSGARVTIGARTAFSNSAGAWVVTEVAAGPVSIVVAKAGFGTTWVSAEARADADPVDIELRPGGAGVVEGIGVVLAPATQGAVVQSVLPGSPAEGKLAPGDLIEEVGGADVRAAAVDEIIARLRGPAGSSVSIALRRGADGKSVDVTRKRLVVPDGTPAAGLAAAPRRRQPGAAPRAS